MFASASFRNVSVLPLLLLVGCGLFDDNPATLAAFVKSHGGTFYELKGLGGEYGERYQIDFDGVVVPPVVFQQLGTIRTPTALGFKNCRMPPGWLKDLSTMPHLRSLNLLGTTNYDSLDPRPLHELQELRELYVEDPSFGDAQFQHFYASPELERLRLGGTAIGDRGLATLKNAKRLHALDLTNTKVTNAGMVYLDGKDGLEFLTLDGTAVGDEGVASLTSCTALKVLGLNKTKITNKIYPLINAFPDLMGLGLGNNNLTEEGIEVLAAHRWLQSIDCKGTRIDLEKVRELLPGRLIRDW